MKKSIKSNSVLNTIKTTKKVVKKSESVILKTQINNNWKLATRSMSGLVRYAKGEGAKDLQKLIDATNKKEGVKISLNQIANVKCRGNCIAYQLLGVECSMSYCIRGMLNTSVL